MIEKRKEEHVKICAEKNISSSRNYFDFVHLLHCALPELDKDEINTETKIFSSKLKAPIVITGITGGFSGAEKLNSRLAQACEKLQLGLGLGSLRAGIENRALLKTYSVITRYNVPFVLGNIGAVQLVDQKKSKALTAEQINRALEAVNANCLAVHLNILQEIVQPDGETNTKGCIQAIKELISNLDVPVILKETGAGISYELALKAKSLGAGVDVGGLGGTSFAAVEYYRAKAKLHKRLGKTFWDWGIPTPVSILNCKKAAVKPIIGSGGVRNGLDSARAIALGADVAGTALPVLKPALSSTDAVVEELELFIEELKSTLFLVGAKNINDLKTKKVILGQDIIEYL